MKSKQDWRNFFMLYTLLSLSQEEVKRLISRPGMHSVNGFSVKVERPLRGSDIHSIISVWSKERCIFKGAVRPDV